MFAIEPPVEPMLAKLAEVLPSGDGFLVRAEVGRLPRDRVSRRDRRLHSEPGPAAARSVFSRAARRLSRTAAAPAACSTARSSSPRRAVSTSTRCNCGCILPPRGSRSSRKRRPPASSRSICSRLTAAICAASPQVERRARLEALLGNVRPPIHLTPTTRDRAVAAEWLERFEGAGLDGVIAKPMDGDLRAGQARDVQDQARAHGRLRRRRLSLAQERWRRAVGSLLLGLYDAKGTLHHVGVTSSFTMAARKELATLLEPLREGALDGHPWREWADPASHAGGRMPGGQSRWSAGKDLSWEPRADRARVRSQVRPPPGRSLSPRRRLPALASGQQPADCRYDQLEVTAPYELEKVFGAAGRPD